MSAWRLLTGLILVRSHPVRILVKDYYTEYGYNNFPKRDEHQDWFQTSFKEEDGFTTLEYERERNTSDIMDNAIKVSTE